MQRRLTDCGPSRLRMIRYSMGPPRSGFFRGEQNSAGTDVVGESREYYAFGAGTRNRERKLEIETPGFVAVPVVPLNVRCNPCPGQ